MPDTEYCDDKIKIIINICKKLIKLFEQYTNEQIEQSKFISESIDLLFMLSWRINELPSAIKFRKYKKNISERSWIVLSFLCNALTMALEDNHILLFNDLILKISDDIKILVNALEDENAVESISLHNIDNFVSFYLDDYVLERMSNAVDVILSPIDTGCELDELLTNECYQLAHLRALEILGEASKLLSTATRKLDTCIPWQIQEGAEVSILTRIRSALEHVCRYKAKLMIKYEPGFFINLVKNIYPVFKIQIRALLDERRRLVGNSKEAKDLTNLNGFIYNNPIALPLPSAQQNLEVVTNIFREFEGELTKKNPLHKADLIDLKQYLNLEHAQELLSLLNNLKGVSVTLEQFINDLVIPCLKQNFNDLTVEEQTQIREKFTKAYYLLTNTAYMPLLQKLGISENDPLYRYVQDRDPRHLSPNSKTLTIKKFEELLDKHQIVFSKQKIQYFFQLHQKQTRGLSEADLSNESEINTNDAKIKEQLNKELVALTNNITNYNTESEKRLLDQARKLIDHAINNYQDIPKKYRDKPDSLMDSNLPIYSSTDTSDTKVKEQLVIELTALAMDISYYKRLLAQSKKLIAPSINKYQDIPKEYRNNPDLLLDENDQLYRVNLQNRIADENNARIKKFLNELKKFATNLNTQEKFLGKLEKFMNEDEHKIFYSHIRQKNYSEILTEKVGAAIELVHMVFSANKEKTKKDKKSDNNKVQTTTETIEKINGLIKKMQILVGHDNPGLKIIRDMAFQFILEEIGHEISLLEQAGQLNILMNNQLDMLKALLIDVCRKRLAHFPLILHETELDYYKEELSIYGLFFELQNLLNQNVDLLVKPQQNLTAERITSAHSAIQEILELLGFHNNPQLFGSITDCEIGVQADINIIVSVIDISIQTGIALQEAELRLSRLLKCSVRVYTQETLEIQLGRYILPRHMLEIKNTLTLARFILQQKFIDNFQSQRWSRFILPSVGTMTRSDYIIILQMKKILNFLLPGHIDDLELLEQTLKSTHNLSSLIENSLRHKLAATEDLAELKKMISIIQGMFVHTYQFGYEPKPLPISPLEDELFFPVIITDQSEVKKQEAMNLYPTFIYNNNYPEKQQHIESIKAGTQLFKINEIYETELKKRSIPHSPSEKLFGIATYIHAITNTGIVVNLRDYPLLIPLETFCRLYITPGLKECYSGRAPYIKVDYYFSSLLTLIDNSNINAIIDDIPGLSTYLANALHYHIAYIMQKMKLTQHFVSSAFALVTSMDCFETQSTAKINRTKIYDFRKKRIENRYIGELIREKTHNNIRLLRIALLQLSDPEKFLIFGLIAIDKKIDEIASGYFDNNEFELTKIAKRLDREQLSIAKQVMLFDPRYVVIENKKQFLAAVRFPTNLNIIADNAIRNKILEYLNIRLNYLARYADLKRNQNQGTANLACLDSPSFIGQFESVLRRFSPITNNPFTGMSYFNHTHASRYLAAAYNDYNWFSLLFYYFDQKSIESLLANQIDMQQIAPILYKNLIREYCSANGTTFNIEVVGHELYCRANFHEEIEYAYSRKKDALHKDLKSSTNNVDIFLKRFIFGELSNINHLICMTNSDMREIELPHINNGILGYASELDRGIQHIYAKLPSHQFEIHPSKPVSFLELIEQSKLQRGCHFQLYNESDYNCSIAIPEMTSTLEQILDFYNWSDAERLNYRQSDYYKSDEIAIKNYANYRGLYADIQSALQGQKECQQTLDRLNARKKQFESDSNHSGISIIEKRILAINTKYREREQQLKDYITMLFNLDFVQIRIQLVLQQPLVIEQLRRLCAEAANETAMTNEVATVVYAIQHTILQELDSSLVLQELFQQMKSQTSNATSSMATVIARERGYGSPDPTTSSSSSPTPSTLST